MKTLETAHLPTQLTTVRAAQARWEKKDLLGLEELTAEEITLLLDTPQSFRDVSLPTVKKEPALRGKTVVNFFFEPATRTRASFELAAKRLSADILNIGGSSSSFQKGESLL